MQVENLLWAMRAEALLGERTSPMVMDTLASARDAVLAFLCAPASLPHYRAFLASQNPPAEWLPRGRERAAAYYRKHILPNVGTAQMSDRCARCGHFNFTHREVPLGATGDEVLRFTDCRHYSGCSCPAFRARAGTR